jgi:hypothetical protein
MSTSLNRFSPAQNYHFIVTSNISVNRTADDWRAKQEKQRGGEGEEEEEEGGIAIS